MIRRFGNMMAAMTVLIGCQLAGEVVVRLCRLPLPASVVGMVLLTVALLLRGRSLPRDAALARTGNALLMWMGLLFVPAGVGVMVNLDLIRAQLLPIVVALIVSPLASMIVAGVIMHRMTAGHRGPALVPREALHAD